MHFEETVIVYSAEFLFGVKVTWIIQIIFGSADIAIMCKNCTDY